MAPTFKAKPVRCFYRYSCDERASHAASHRVGYRKKTAVGEYYYVHPAVPGLAFPTAAQAMQAAMDRAAFAMPEAA